MHPETVERHNIIRELLDGFGSAEVSGDPIEKVSAIIKQALASCPAENIDDSDLDGILLAASELAAGLPDCRLRP